MSTTTLFVLESIVFFVLMMACIFCFVKQSDKRSKAFQKIALRAVGTVADSKRMRRWKTSHSLHGGEDRYERVDYFAVTYAYQNDGVCYTFRRKFDKYDFPREHEFWLHPRRPQRAYWNPYDYGRRARYKAAVFLQVLVIVAVWYYIAYKIGAIL